MLLCVCQHMCCMRERDVGKVRTLTSHTLQFRCCLITHSFNTRYVDALLFHVVQEFRLCGKLWLTRKPQWSNMDCHELKDAS